MRFSLISLLVLALTICGSLAQMESQAYKGKGIATDDAGTSSRDHFGDQIRKALIPRGAKPLSEMEKERRYANVIHFQGTPVYDVYDTHEIQQALVDHPNVIVWFDDIEGRKEIKQLSRNLLGEIEVHDLPWYNLVDIIAQLHQYSSNTKDFGLPVAYVIHGRQITPSPAATSRASVTVGDALERAPTVFNTEKYAETAAKLREDLKNTGMVVVSQHEPGFKRVLLHLSGSDFMGYQVNHHIIGYMTPELRSTLLQPIYKPISQELAPQKPISSPDYLTAAIQSSSGQAGSSASSKLSGSSEGSSSQPRRLPRLKPDSIVKEIGRFWKDPTKTPLDPDQRLATYSGRSHSRGWPIYNLLETKLGELQQAVVDYDSVWYYYHGPHLPTFGRIATNPETKKTTYESARLTDGVQNQVTLYNTMKNEGVPQAIIDVVHGPPFRQDAQRYHQIDWKHKSLSKARVVEKESSGLGSDHDRLNLIKRLRTNLENHGLIRYKEDENTYYGLGLKVSGNIEYRKIAASDMEGILGKMKNVLRIPG